MKKMIYMGALVLIATSGIFWSCQEDEFLTNPENGLMLKSAMVYPADGCQSVCIEPGSGDFYTKSGVATGNIGGNSKQIGYTVYNTETDFVVELAYSRTPITSDINSTVKVTVDGSELTKQMVKNATIIYTIPKDIIGCETVNWSFVETVWDGQNAISASGSYDLIGVCEDCDDASFSYKTEDNLKIVFSYNHNEEAELTIEFTFPQVVDLELNGDNKYVAPDGKTYAVNNPTNQTVFTWTGLVGCSLSEQTTFEFAHAVDCGPSTAKDGKANIWTDAKIVAVNGVLLVDNLETPEIEGPVSLKGSLANIVYEGCPVSVKE